jgi:hypothetical protein
MIMKSALRLNCDTFPSTKDERRRYEGANVELTFLEQISDNTQLAVFDALLIPVCNEFPSRSENNSLADSRQESSPTERETF